MTLALEHLIQEAMGDAYGAEEELDKAREQLEWLRTLPEEEASMDRYEPGLLRNVRVLADTIQADGVPVDCGRRMATLLEYMAELIDKYQADTQMQVQLVEDAHNARIDLEAEKSPALEAMRRNPASWVIRKKATGEVVLETFDRKTASAINREAYEAIPIIDYLNSLNGAPLPPPAPVVRKRKRPVKE